MPMVRHDAVGKQTHGMLGLRIRQGAQESGIVAIVCKHLVAAVGAIQDVINEPASLYSMWPSHAGHADEHDSDSQGKSENGS